MPERDCNKCKPRNKKEWGCEGGATLPLRIDGEDTYTCPLRPAFENRRLYGYLMSQHRFYSKGILLVAGGSTDQPSKWCKAMAIIDVVVDECHAEKAEKANKANKPNRPKRR